MKQFLGLIRKGGIDASGEEQIAEFIKSQTNRFDAQRGYYAILKKSEQDNNIPTFSQIDARNSVRDKDSDYMIAFLITADRRETAENFLNLFPNAKVGKEVVEAQINNEWRLRQLSMCLSTWLSDLDVEIIY